MSVSVFSFNWNELIFNFRQVVGCVNWLDILFFISVDFNFSPSINFNSHVFFNDICVSISNNDLCSFLDNVELVIFCDENCASVLISNNNISWFVNSSFISQSLSLVTVTDLTSKCIVTLVPGFTSFIVMKVGFCKTIGSFLSYCSIILILSI